MTRKPAYTDAEAMTFWSVFEAKHGLRQPENRNAPTMTDAGGNTAEPLPTTDQPEERE